MGFMDKVLKKESSFDVEDFLNRLDTEEESYEDADAYVKPVLLISDSDADIAVNELKKGNFILLNIADLAKRNATKLRDLVSRLKETTDSIDGDIARVSHDHVLLTPSKVKIVKRRQGA